MNLYFKPKKIKYLVENLNFKHIKNVYNEFSKNLNYHINDIFNLSSNEGLDLKIECITSNERKSDGYIIESNPNQIKIKASNERGAYYGILTLKKLIEKNDNRCFEIEDYPDLEVRGVMLDISRSKVPKLQTIKDLIVKFAKLRYNHLELYVEGFSFEYKSFKQYLTDNNYISLEEYLECEQFAKKYYIDFVPNQNGFGHMADWLKLDEFKHLAECEEGFYMWGSNRAPSTLDPTSNDSINLVKQMYKDMIPYTSSKYFNMNFDEPYELGFGKSKNEVGKTSVADVYIDYFNKLAEYVKSFGKTPMLWGDVLIKHSDKIDKLPKDVIFIDWGYNKDYLFEKHAKILNEKDVKYLLAPGTSSWSTITSRLLDMKTTITNSALAAKKYNGLGIMICDWGDIGHLQYLPISYLAFIYGGLIAWQQIDFYTAILYFKEMMGDDALCEAMIELAKYHMLEGEYRDYGSRLFSPILWAEHSQREKNPIEFFKSRVYSNLITKENYELLKISFTKAKSLLAIAKNTIETAEVKNSLLLLEVLNEINQKLQMQKNGLTISFENEIITLKAYLIEHKRLWNERNNPNGYKFSAQRIEWLLKNLMELDGKENL